MTRSMCSLFLAGMIGAAPLAHSDGTESPPSKHQMMKECMAKQKASDGGISKEQMRKNCRDVTKTEKENAKTEKADSQPAGAEQPAGQAPSPPRP